MAFRKWGLSSLLVATLTFAAAPARADSISFSSVSSASVVALGGLYNGGAWAGELSWIWNGANRPEGLDQTFYSYCVDLLKEANPSQGVAIGSTEDLTGGSYVADAGARAAWLFNTYAADVHDAINNNIQTAALQVAIWEALYDTTLDLATGNVRLLAYGSMSKAIMTQAANYLTALAGADYQDSTAKILFAQNGQSQIVNPVPEPSTIVLLGSGLLFMAWYARRRQGELSI